MTDIGLCLIEGCGGVRDSRHLCAKHYHRLRRYGDPLIAKRPHASLEERLWGRVLRSDGCWEFTGTRNGMGYGVLGRHGRRGGNVLAHRAAWELTFGPVPAELCVLHRCDNPPCVRPDHLWLGTRMDNNRDMVAKGRHRTQKKVAA
jgi:hypothetical protein